ncbi:hypothetical protein C477_00895 [Haloterrigena salina JCM 13891]|uniref:Uncharacterized protein n=1 Tax=Haloterrigena salina JCM 13891 TaxID=1227488 RepID=M0CRH9_9EURY|nr:hypothetical protein C477_00895 [Haloterrigena salina JCM 13891]
MDRRPNGVRRRQRSDDDTVGGEALDSATGSRVPWVRVTALKRASLASAMVSTNRSRSIRPASVSTTRTPTTPTRNAATGGRRSDARDPSGRRRRLL